MQISPLGDPDIDLFFGGPDHENGWAVFSGDPKVFSVVGDAINYGACFGIGEGEKLIDRAVLG